MKICCVCKKNKPLDRFHRRRRNKTDGRKSMCIKCTKEYDRQYVINNREKHNENNRRWCRDNKEYYSAIRRKIDRKRIDNLGDSYLKKLIAADYNISRTLITKEMIEAKRRVVTKRRAKHVGKGKIYFIKCNSFIKIGFSTNIKKRMRNLKVSNPYPLKCIAWFKGTKSDERDLHVMFEEFHVTGEWFKYNKPIKDYIKLERKRGKICLGL